MDSKHHDNENEGSLSLQLGNSSAEVPIIEIDQRHMKTVMVRNSNSSVTSPRKVFYSKSPSQQQLNKSIDNTQQTTTTTTTMMHTSPSLSSYVPAMSLISHNESSCCNLIESASRDDTTSIDEINNNASNSNNNAQSDSHLDSSIDQHQHQQEPQQARHSLTTTTENDSNNLLKPLNRDDGNNSSQSSLDARIRYGDEIDLVPLVKLNGNGNSNRESLPLETAVECIVSTKMSDHHYEAWYTIMIQVVLPFFVAGFGMVAAGVFLDEVQHWPVFSNINAIYTLVPALLGLKGNLEMTLASRLSTQVNLGKVRDKETIISALLGNFALTQAQAIVVGFLASVSAILIKLFTERDFDMNNSLVLVAGSMSTASLASLLLAGLMMLVIILSKRLNINPDNIATPIAASLGDLVTLTILAYLCTYLYQIKSTYWILLMIIIGFGLLVPLFFYFSLKNEFVRDALCYGWVPIIMAMVISSTGGFIMGSAVSVYQSIAVFQPVINGVGGNLVAIFASRLSTALHRTSTQGKSATWRPTHWYQYPYEAFFGKQNPEAKTAIVLSLLSLPGHLIFFLTISKIKAGHNVSTLSFHFIAFYLFLAVLQVTLLLLIGYWLVHYAWSTDNNPDNVCIPYLTAIGDFLGTAFLAFCFHILYLAGEKGLRTV